MALYIGGSDFLFVGRLVKTKERRPQGGSMTDMREIYLTPLLNLKISLKTSRNWPKLRKNLVDHKFDEAEWKGIKNGVPKNMRARLFQINSR